MRVAAIDAIFPRAARLGHLGRRAAGVAFAAPFAAPQFSPRVEILQLWGGNLATHNYWLVILWRMKVMITVFTETRHEDKPRRSRSISTLMAWTWQMVERVNSRLLGDAKNRFAFGVNTPSEDPVIFGFSNFTNGWSYIMGGNHSIWRKRTTPLATDMNVWLEWMLYSADHMHFFHCNDGEILNLIKQSSVYQQISQQEDKDSKSTMYRETWGFSYFSLLLISNRLLWHYRGPSYMF